jgi:hypothetical protein
VVACVEQPFCFSRLLVVVAIYIYIYIYTGLWLWLYWFSIKRYRQACARLGLPFCRPQAISVSGLSRLGDVTAMALIGMKVT